MGDGIRQTVREVLTDNPEAVQDFMNKEPGAKNYLVGQVMAATGGSADPGEANDLIQEVIEDEAPDWPVTFTVYRRPVDRDTLPEQLANEIPRWAHDQIPEGLDDPTAHEFGFEVTVTENGGVEIEVIDDE